jgi:hypothetical protein
VSAIERCLAALYLRGLPRPVEPHPRSWPAVLSVLRRGAVVSISEAADALRAAGFSSEAACLGGNASEHAARLMDSELIVTSASSCYPRAWVEKLGAGAPPALYACGRLEFLRSECLAVVGSRNPPSRMIRFASKVVESAEAMGYAIVSGGAPGIDRVAASASVCVEIWPGGLGMRWGAHARGRGEVLYLSAWPPRELFSTAGAMERNALIYALGRGAFVGHARFKQGGSWHGATDALRRRLTRVLVTEEAWSRQDEPTRRALVGLGAFELAGHSPPELMSALTAEPRQPWLPAFGQDPAIANALAAY